MTDAPVLRSSTDLSGLRQRAENCAKYDFDTVEMIECKWVLWDEILEALHSSDGAACGDSSQASQRLSGDLQPAPSEAVFLEDNIATVAHHLRQNGARLSVDHGGGGKVGLIVDPGEVLQEIARRLGVAQASMDRDQVAKIFAYIWHGDAAEWKGFLSKADAFLAFPGSPPAPLQAGEIIEQCAKIAEAQKQAFLSPQYASNQPFGSICERFACDEVAKAIRALSLSSTDREGSSSWRDSWEKLPRPEDWIICNECAGKGDIETVYPFPDDPYFCAVNKCEACNGKGGHLRDTTSSLTSTDRGTGA